jgi:hypothetical protein
MKHWTSPDDRLFRIFQKEANAHQLDSKPLKRLNPFSVFGRGLAFDAQHRRQRRSVDIRIEKAYAGPEATKSQREIRRHGALTHPALATHHQDDVSDIWNRIAAGRFSRRNVDLELKLGELDAKRLERCLDSRMERSPHFFGRGAHSDLCPDAPVFQTRIDERPQGTEWLLKDRVFDFA